jgi:hypothetical protein
LARRQCPCGRFFRPDVRHRRTQKYCRRCAKKAKRARDRLHKQSYRDTGLGREQRKRENAKLRAKPGWKESKRQRRKANSGVTSQQERERSRRYYERHHDQILEKRRQQRAAPR